MHPRRRPRRLLAPLAAAALALAVAPAGAAAALHPQPLDDVTPPDARDLYCPADLGAADAAAWLRVGPFTEENLRVDVAATGLAPGARGPLAALPGLGGCPVAAALPDGSALVAASRGGLMSDEGPIVAATRSAGGAFGPARRLSRGIAGSRPGVALAAGGDAVVTWQETVERDGGGRLLPFAAIRTGAGGRFAAPVALGARLDSSTADWTGLPDGPPQAGIDAAGNALAVWFGPAAAASGSVQVTSFALWSALRPAGGSFGAPRELGRFSGPELPRLAVAPTGEAVLAVVSDDGVRVATGTAAGGLSALARQAESGTGAAVAIAPGGAAVVGWAQGTRTRSLPRIDRLVTIGRSAGAEPFGAVQTLAPLRAAWHEAHAETLDLAIAGDGRTLATWTDEARLPDGLALASAYAAHGAAGGAWQAPARVGSPCRWLSMPPLAAFSRDGRPRVTLVDANLIDGGDAGWPTDSRLRVVRFGEQPAADATPPRVRLTARRRQLLRDDLRRTGALRARVVCGEDCDAHVFAVVKGRRDLRAGLFPRFARLTGGRAAAVRLRRTADFFDWTRGAYRERRITQARVVVHACDAAGNLGRASVPVDAWVPRFTRGGW